MELTIQHTVDTKFELCRDVECVLEIGRAFQQQDPMLGAHHDTVKLLCDTIEYLRDKQNKKDGNAAVLREALEYCLDFIMRIDRAFNPYMQQRLETAVSKARDALSAPPRNCDRLKDAHIAIVGAIEDGVVDCGFGAKQMAEWLLATATEEGDAK